MNFSAWFDDYSLIHLNRNPKTQESENGPLFTAEFHVLYNKITGIKHCKLRKTINTINPNLGTYNPSGVGGEHFSHDNMTALYCLLYLQYGFCYKDLDIFTKYVRHPRDVLFFLFAKIAHKKGFIYTLVKHILLIIPSIAMLITCYQRYKKRNGVKILKTDGKLLTWIRCETFGLNKTMKIAELILEHRHGFDSWGRIFRIYFINKQHPNIILSKMLGKI